MNRLTVESTTLHTIAYDVDRQILQLEFRDRTIYHYYDVPAEEYQNLVDARSKGGHFNRNIRGHYVHARIGTAFSLS